MSSVDSCGFSNKCRVWIAVVFVINGESVDSCGLVIHGESVDSCGFSYKWRECGLQWFSYKW